MADGQIWAACGAGRVSYQSFISCRLRRTGKCARCGSHFKLLVDCNSEKHSEDFFAISQCDGLGWLAVAGSVGFLFLPDCWAASLVCLFKLAQRGPAVARVILFCFFFWSNLNINSVHVSFSLPATCSLPQQPINTY